MTAVACVVRNRVQKNHSSYYTEVTKAWQFSSITAKGDPQLGLYPRENDEIWTKAQSIATSIIDGSLPDSTGGATLYYADSIPFPSSWNKSKVKETVKIGHHTFFQEI